MPTRKALVIVFDGVEEVEALTPVDILRRAGIEVTIASVNGASMVTGRNDIAFRADCPLSLVENERFDLIFLPGGPGSLQLIGNSQVADLLKRQNDQKRELAAICAAPKVLASQGLLNARFATGHASVQEDLPKFRDEPVVEDGHIVTSRGAGTALPFALTLVRRLEGEEAAAKVASSIHY